MRHRKPLLPMKTIPSSRLAEAGFRCCCCCCCHFRFRLGPSRSQSHQNQNYCCIGWCNSDGSLWTCCSCSSYRSSQNLRRTRCCCWIQSWNRSSRRKHFYIFHIHYSIETRGSMSSSRSSGWSCCCCCCPSRRSGCSRRPRWPRCCG